MADLTNRPDRWTDYLPETWQHSINTNPLMNALGRALSRPAPNLERASLDIFGRPEDRAEADRQWLLQQARGPSWLERTNPVVQDGVNKLGLYANFIGPGAKLPPAAPKPTGIRAYHGSPHDFNAERLVKFPDGRTEYIVGTPDRLPDIPAGAQALKDFPLGRFREDKIGTGEGAQAYGRGVAYVAESENVARGYKATLSNRTIEGRPIDYTDPRHLAADYVDSFGLRAGEEMRRDIGRPGVAEALKFVEQGKVPRVDGGRMYEVRINADPEQFLDWDKPLSQQPEAVKNWYNQRVAPGIRTREIGDNPNVGKLFDVMHPEGGSIGVFPQEKLPDVMKRPADFVPARGEDLARQYQDALRDAGIPGVKYLDQSSRAVGHGSRNFVVFDDKLIEILRKYGLLPPVAAGTAAALNQQEPQL